MSAVLAPGAPAPGATAAGLAAPALKVTQGRVLRSEFTKFRSLRSTLYTLLVAVVLVIGQAALGAIVVEGELPPALVTAHLATAMLLVGDLVFLLVQISTLSEARPPGSVPRSLAWLSISPGIDPLEHLSGAGA